MNDITDADVEAAYEELFDVPHDAADPEALEEAADALFQGPDPYTSDGPYSVTARRQRLQEARAAREGRPPVSDEDLVEAYDSLFH